MTATEEIVGHAIEQLQSVYHCTYVQIGIEEAGVVRRLGSAGARSGEPDESFHVSEGPITLRIELCYGTDDAGERRERRIFAESVANSCVALSLMHAAEDVETGRLLICDDDEGTRLLMRHVLRRDGFNVIEAANGLLAYARALEFRPDLIIIDWIMPVLDGHDAVVRLKADPFTASTPILMLTSRSQSHDKVAALAAGVQDFLAKPFEPAALTSAVRQQLRWRRLLSDEKSDVVPGVIERADVADTVALAQLVEIAEAAEERRAFGDAALAYTKAAEVASNPDVSNKFRRLSGKMFLTLAESSTDPAVIQRGYTSAARAFLTAGNMSLAQAAHHSGQIAGARAS